MKKFQLLLSKLTLHQFHSDPAISIQIFKMTQATLKGINQDPKHVDSISPTLQNLQGIQDSVLDKHVRNFGGVKEMLRPL